MPAPVLAPMLAVSGRVVGSLSAYAAELKLDGWRALITVEAGVLTVHSRHGTNLTSRLPELAPLAELGRDVVLDCELVTGGRLTDFYELSGALASGGRFRRPTVTPVVFDVLWLDDVLQTRRPYRERRAVLESLELPPPAVMVGSYPGEDAGALLAAAEDLGCEGIVLKAVDGRYEPGARSKAWVKAKGAGWQAHAESRRPKR